MIIRVELIISRIIASFYTILVGYKKSYLISLPRPVPSFMELFKNNNNAKSSFALLTWHALNLCADMVKFLYTSIMLHL